MGDIADYKELIEEVRSINPQAALYLENEAKNLKSFIPSRYINFCFDKEETVQGSDYWKLIEKDLNEYKRKLQCKHGISGYCCSECKELPKYKTTIIKDKSEVDDAFVLYKKKKEKECIKCHKNKEINADNFFKNSLLKDGFENICKKCKRDYAKNYAAKKKNEKITSLMDMKDNIKPIELIKVKTEPVIEDNKIKLDLSNILNEYPDLYNKLVLSAKEEIRPIEHHALYIIKDYLNKE